MRALLYHLSDVILLDHLKLTVLLLSYEVSHQVLTFVGKDTWRGHFKNRYDDSLAPPQLSAIPN